MNYSAFRGVNQINKLLKTSSSHCCRRQPCRKSLRHHLILINHSCFDSSTSFPTRSAPQLTRKSRTCTSRFSSMKSQLQSHWRSLLSATTSLLTSSRLRPSHRSAESSQLSTVTKTNKKSRDYRSDSPSTQTFHNICCDWQKMKALLFKKTSKKNRVLARTPPPRIMDLN